MTKQFFGFVGNAKEQLVKRFLAWRRSQPETVAEIEQQGSSANA